MITFVQKHELREVIIMEFDYTLLRRRMRERYASEADFARDLGISPASLRQKLRNEGDFSMGQMRKTAKLLDIDAQSIPKYFFVEKVHKSELFVGCLTKGARRARYVH